jgi:hypothetical protein
LAASRYPLTLSRLPTCWLGGGRSRMAPLLAEEGIDVDNIDVPDLDTLQQAMNRAIERQNMVRFTQSGKHANSPPSPCG